MAAVQDWNTNLGENRESEYMEAYLDNSATTRCSTSVVDLMTRVLTKDYGNASSMHMKGVEAEKYMKEAAARIAKTLRCTEKEIIFTSGGTESNNLAIVGTAMANRRSGMHLITTSIEPVSYTHLDMGGYNQAGPDDDVVDADYKEV